MRLQDLHETMTCMRLLDLHESVRPAHVLKTCMRLQDLHGTNRLARDYKTCMKLQDLHWITRLAWDYKVCLSCKTCNRLQHLHETIRLAESLSLSLYPSSWSCVCWPNNLMVSNPLILSMNLKYHSTKLMTLCNPKVCGVVAASLTPWELASPS